MRSCKHLKSLGLYVSLSFSSLLYVGCGQENNLEDISSSSQLKVIGGAVVSTDDPISNHTVMVGHIEPSMFLGATIEPHCTGTLILDGTYVLTAAHCILSDDPTSPHFVMFNKEIISEKSESGQKVNYTQVSYPAIKMKYLDSVLTQRMRQDIENLSEDQQKDSKAIDKLLKKIVKDLNSKKHPDLALLKIVQFKPEELPSSYKPIQLANTQNTLAKGSRVHIAGFGMSLEANKEGISHSEEFNELKDSVKSTIQSTTLVPQAKSFGAMLAQELFGIGEDDDYTLVAKSVSVLREMTDNFEEMGILRSAELQYDSYASDKRIYNGLPFSDLMVLKPLHERNWEAAGSGDSGGPAYIKAEDGSLLQVGVASISDFIQSSFYVDIRPHTTWIDDTAALLAEMDSRITDISYEGILDLDTEAPGITTKASFHLKSEKP